tara:strand:+ start:76 stop:456 length:381 start_codon:yes stop_codon:yes gene_type:complete
LRVLLILFFFIPALSWSKNITYTCNYAKSYEANFVYPELISVVVDLQQQSLITYKEDGNELTNSYYCERCSSTKDRVEIWTKKYNPWSLNPIDTDNARVFEIYAEDLVGHLWRPLQGGYDYRCKIS